MNAQEQQNIIIVGSEDDGELLFGYDIRLGQTLWAVTKDSKPGDRVWFYIAEPISAIVATGIIGSEVTYSDEEMQLWRKQYVATIKNLQIVRSTPMTQLKRAFRDWEHLVDFEENFILPANWVNFFREVLEVENAGHD